MSSLRKIWNNNGVFLVGQGVFYLTSYAFVLLASNRLDTISFGRLTLITNFFFILNIPVDALFLLAIRYISDTSNPTRIAQAFSTIKHLATRAALIAMGIYILLLLPMMWFFHLPNITTLSLFIPTIAMLFASTIYKAKLHADQQFNKLGLVMIIEGITKLSWIMMLSLVSMTLNQVVLGFAVSLFLATISGFKLANIPVTPHRIPQTLSLDMYRFYKSAIIASTALSLMIALDVFLANHLLTPTEAGLYGYANLFGRLVIMASTAISALFLPSITKSTGTHGVKTPFRLGLLVNGFIAASAIVTALTYPQVFSLVARTDLSTLYPYMPAYLTAIACLSITAYIIRSQVLLKQRYFSYIPLPYIVQLTLITINTSSLPAFFTSFTTISLALFCLTLLVLTLNYGKEQWRQLAQFFTTSITTSTSPGKHRILIYNWRDTKHVWAGGAEVYVHELAQRWVQAGHHVTLFCSYDRKSTPDQVIDGIHIIRRGGFVTVYIWAALYYLFKFRGKFDLIIDCENGIPFFTPFYSRLPKILVIHHVHQEVFKENLFYPLAKLAQFLELHLMPLVYRRTELVTISDTSKKAIRQHLFATNPISIIPSGIDLSLYKPGVKSATPLVVYCGRLKRYKRLEDFIATAKIIHQRLPQVKFIIAGTGDDQERLKSITKAAGLERVIQFTGFISQSQKIALFQQAWVTINPSSMEGWSITSIESNGCGTPVIGADVPGLRDSINHLQTGFLVPMGDIDQYALECFRVLTNQALRTRLSQNAFQWAQAFSWDRSAERFVSLISHCISHPTAPTPITIIPRFNKSL